MNFATYPSLAGRVVFVTGGASGIGADMVRAFAGNGAKVAFVDIQAEAGEALAAELGRRCHAAAFPALRPDRHRRPARRRSTTTAARLGPIARAGQQRRQRRPPRDRRGDAGVLGPDA